jgi:hypothetical protein
MAINIIRLMQLMVYMVITSQLLFYFFILSDSLKLVSLENFIELRKVVDLSFGHRFKMIYYAGLLLSLTVVLLQIKQPGSILFITAVISLVCLLVDVAIAMKGNVPINSLFNNYQSGDTTQNWQALRLEWINLINIRGAFIVTGICAQLIGLVFTRQQSDL